MKIVIPCFTFITLSLLVWVLLRIAQHLRDRIRDNLFIGLALMGLFKCDGFTVVRPTTSLPHRKPVDPETEKERKKYILESLRIDGYDIGPLLDRLSARNKEPANLTLPSSPQKGYLIDYEDNYLKYFSKDGGGWEKWYQENPEAHGHTTISLPAYDPRNKILLIYIGTQFHYLVGEGYLIACRYGWGRLEELARALLWVS